MLGVNGPVDTHASVSSWIESRAPGFHPALIQYDCNGLNATIENVKEHGCTEEVTVGLSGDSLLFV